MEARRGVAAERCREEVFACVVVHHAGEVTLVVVLRAIGRCALLVDDGTCQLIVVLGEHVAFAGRERIGIGIVVFVTDHHIDVVLANLLRVVQNLLRVELQLARVAFREQTFLAGELSEVGVLDHRRAGFIERDTRIERELEVLQERDVEEGRSVEGVSFGGLRVEARLREGVAVGEDRALHAGVLAIVVELDAVFVVEDVAVSVADIERTVFSPDCPVPTQQFIRQII